MDLQFSGCFDDAKLRLVQPLLGPTYRELNDMAPWLKGRWPTEVVCFTHKEIVDGRRRGAGHGMTKVGCQDQSDCNTIWLNAHMTPAGIWLVLIHENLHHAFPDATEDELNNVLVPEVFERVTGRELPRRWARKQGLGPPRPGIGDRGYVRSEWR